MLKMNLVNMYLKILKRLEEVKEKADVMVSSKDIQEFINNKTKMVSVDEILTSTKDAVSGNNKSNTSDSSKKTTNDNSSNTQSNSKTNQ